MCPQHEPDCPICLDPMSKADLEHPLRCERQCGFNFCEKCIERLITSSKDDYLEASDGSKHVKVLLHCPNCRSDLGSSIRDTLVLRKVRKLHAHSESNTELTESEERLKEVLHDNDIESEIEAAQKREDAFFGRDEPQQQGGVRDSIVELEVEADILSGVNQSVIIRKKNPLNRQAIDPTLFYGLECAMTKEEQLCVTHLMTSGDTGNLALAAELLHGIATRVQKGLPPPKIERPQLRKQSSIYDLIEESQHARKAKPTNNHKHAMTKGAPTGRRTNLNLAKYAQHKKVDVEIREHARFLKFHPLPVRMPRFTEFHAKDESSSSFFPISFLTKDTWSSPLTFCDDTWDGSIADAFCKISVSSGKEPVVSKKVVVDNIGVRAILEASVGDEDVTVAPVGAERGRVVVASVKSEGGRQGVLKGDVVTHFNGEEFDGTAEELEKAMKACVQKGGDGTFTLVFNADLSVAEVLRRRATL